MSHEKDFKIEKSKCFTFRFILYFIVISVYIISLAIFLCISGEKANTKIFEISISFALIIFTFVQFEIQHQKNEIETFREYNKKYDILNDDLYSIINSRCIKKFDEEQKSNNNKKMSKALIIDYLVLCSEEYYWRRQGYISKELWINWQKGMEEKFKDFDRVKCANKIIEYEAKYNSNSYYGFFTCTFLEKYLPDNKNKIKIEGKDICYD
ncbi:MAG: hypothetical protein NTY74_01655 [Ignavibacteriae bacterium]|nr:hypothetical protein [Ignavibacteriota bacterium]